MSPGTTAGSRDRSDGARVGAVAARLVRSKLPPTRSDHHAPNRAAIAAGA